MWYLKKQKPKQFFKIQAKEFLTKKNVKKRAKITNFEVIVENGQFKIYFQIQKSCFTQFKNVFRNWHSKTARTDGKKRNWQHWSFY